MTIDTSTWQKIEFGDIARNLTTAVKDPLLEGIERYVGLEHIEPGNIHIKSWGNVVDGTTFTRVFYKGQVLFGKRRAYQRKAAIAEFDGICSGDILVFKANEMYVVSELLPFIVQSDKFFDYAIKTSAGSLSPRTKFKDLAKLKFKLPPLDEQKRLAGLLWSVDEVIKAYRKTVGLLRMSLQVFMDDLIKEPDENSAKLRDFVMIEKGLTYSSNDYGDEKIGEILINLKCFVKFGGFNKDGIKFYKGEYEDKYILENNDLIIANTDVTRNGDVVGYPVIVPDFGNRVVLFTMDVSRLKIKNKDQMTAGYLFYLLRTRWAHWYMYSHSSGTTVLHLNVNSVNELPIPKVNIIVQKNIVNKLKAIEKNIEKYQNLAETANHIQKQIINQLFGGIL
jgi:type I restriction enzyme S subunit